MIITIIGQAYSLPLTQSPHKLKRKYGTSTIFILQPQETLMSYRLDGIEECVCGFILSELEILELSGEGIVLWATDEPYGRVVIQEAHKM